MTDHKKMHAVIEHLFGGDMVAGTFKTVVWVAVAAVLGSVVQTHFP